MFPLGKFSLLLKKDETGSEKRKCTFYFVSLHVEWARSPEKSVAFLDVVDIWFSLCMVEIIYEATNCVYWQQFLKVFILYTMPVFNAVLVQWEIRGHWHSVIFWLMIVDGEIPKLLAIVCWEMLFLNSLPMHFFKKVENLAPPLLVKEWAIRRCSFHTQSWYC